MTNELQIIKVNYLGDHEEEYIEIFVNEKCNLGNYAIFDSTYDEKKELSNVFPHFYRFPKVIVDKGTTIYLHTCSGTNTKKNNIVHFYWGSEDSIWNDNEGDTVHIIKYAIIDTHQYSKEKMSLVTMFENKNKI